MLTTKEMKYLFCGGDVQPKLNIIKCRSLNKYNHVYTDLTWNISSVWIIRTTSELDESWLDGIKQVDVMIHSSD